MQIINDTQYSDKHATTKVILCKDLESSASKGKPRLYQFSAKRIRTQQRPIITRIKIQTCNKDYNLNEGRTQHKSKESTILHENQ